MYFNRTNFKHPHKPVFSVYTRSLKPCVFNTVLDNVLYAIINIRNVTRMKFAFAPSLNTFDQSKFIFLSHKHFLKKELVDKKFLEIGRVRCLFVSVQYHYINITITNFPKIFLSQYCICTTGLLFCCSILN